MSLRSKRLVQAAMLFRPEHKKYTGHLHPRLVKKLITITKEPQPLQYKLHPIIPNLNLQYPHPEPLYPLQ